MYVYIYTCNKRISSLLFNVFLMIIGEARVVLKLCLNIIHKRYTVCGVSEDFPFPFEGIINLVSECIK